MALRKSLVALLAVGALLVAGGVASAAFPNYTGCPSGVRLCLNIQAVSGNLNIKGFNVPLGNSLEIRGGFTEEGAFVPPRGSNGLYSTPVPVPGGLLGIDWLPGTEVLAITELTAPLRINLQTGAVILPVKVRLVNLLLGMNCHIGTDSRPIMLNLATGATSPPPPNRSISGRLGVPSAIGTEIHILGQVNVENSFAVPTATSCGLGLGLINAAVNLKLGLPAAAGTNSIEVTNNLAIRAINP